MSKMNKEQRNHIVNRIWSIRREKKDDLAELRSKAISEILTEATKRKVKQILSGVAKIKSKIPLDATTIDQVFDFQDSPAAWSDKECAKIQEEFDHKDKEIAAKATQLTDEAMLGSPEEAIQILRDYEAF